MSVNNNFIAVVVFAMIGASAVGISAQQTPPVQAPLSPQVPPLPPQSPAPTPLAAWSGFVPGQKQAAG